MSGTTPASLSGSSDICNYRATLEQGGFGIGLNIVSKICKDYNIKIVVDSELNESTTFKLIF